MDKIKEIKSNFKKEYKEHNEKWNLLEKALISDRAENMNTSLKKVQSIIHISEILKSIVKNTKKYIAKNQTPVYEPIDLNLLSEGFNQFLNYAIYIQRSQKSTNTNTEGVLKIYEDLLQLISKMKKQILKQVHKQEMNTKSSLFYLQLLSDTENILFHVNKILVIGN